mmetsp:Transcript_13221/g.19948  ORF Transcript_13221/g.19948 Transcript_13221/m.19948 type:complete len:228 (+) Transcript_13221:146-829(+)|eukprot:CAMPEP_0117423556 /NCGR_PEP_ID=MMETSP0758-20121206/4146_1 /TAXON_ID=63605 /ORGANISM="Percolomonas cosmopolitus, Strain AE-1 (ATCC 50343)" /LENGTH=227 /DNA_ID=CAMNT_0005206795 /DNA_START=123 /DNA_END=806 /DNA_ORIENTATION=-
MNKENRPKVEEEDKKVIVETTNTQRESYEKEEKIAINERRLKRMKKLGYTELHKASQEGQYNIVKRLVKEGNIEINKTTRRREKTPLHMASAKGHKEIVNILLEHKADINFKSKNGGTALQEAVKQNQEHIVELLIQKGANIFEKDNDGMTAMHYAAFNGNEKIIDLLKEEEDYSKKKSPTTPLHLSCSKHHKGAAKVLIEGNVPINGQNEEGYSPLHCALLEDWIS